MTLNEHLLIYMLEKNKTRPATERAIIEFLASLKYYCELWQRAKLYANLAGFVSYDDRYQVLNRTKTSEKMLPTTLCDGSHDESDTI